MVAHPWIRPADILTAVSEWTGVSVEGLTKGRHYGREQAARYLLWAALRESGMTFPEIGGYLRRHHTTILHALNTHPVDPDELAAILGSCQRRR